MKRLEYEYNIEPRALQRCTVFEILDAPTRKMRAKSAAK